MTSKAFSVVGQTVGYARTLDHLRAWKLRLPGHVREMVVAVSASSGPEHEGTKLFVCQNVPQIKFHNPAVKVALESRDSDNSEIIFVADDGGRQVLEVTGLQWKDIQTQLNSLFTEKQS